MPIQTICPTYARVNIRTAIRSNFYVHSIISPTIRVHRRWDAGSTLLSSFVNWMINRVKRRRGWEARFDRESRGGNLNSSCAVNVPKALLREVRRMVDFGAPDIDREERQSEKNEDKERERRSQGSPVPSGFRHKRFSIHMFVRRWCLHTGCAEIRL
jgi:hypothetical protein